MAGFVIEGRILAGLQFVDVATAAPIDVPLHVRAAAGSPTVKTYPNLRNIYVVSEAEGLEAYVASFASAPATPPLGDISVQLEVRDPNGVYLPRQFTLDLPRSADPSGTDTVFEPIAVGLLRSPRASRSTNWAMVSVRLLVDPTDEPVDAALLRVVHDPGGSREILGWGMSVLADPQARQIERRQARGPRWVHFTDRHVGEARVPVVGLSDQVWGVAEDEDVLLSDIGASLEVVPMTLPGPERLPDPDSFFATPATVGNSQPITLSVGGDVHLDPFSVTI